MPKKTYTDNNGNEFKTIREAAEFYNMSTATAGYRMRHGIPLEAPPNTKQNKVPEEARTDHEGRVFPSVTEMLKFYHIKSSLYYNRKAHGMNKKECLTGKWETPIQSGNLACRTDHEGNVFPSAKAMREFYHVDANIFYSRRRHGWTLEQALTGVKPEKPDRYSDHENRTFKTQSEMAEFYHMSTETIRSRTKKGMTLEQALTSPTNQIHKCVDHEGREFSSCQEMLRFYHIKTSTFYYRIRNNWTLEEAITGVRKQPETQNDEGKSAPVSVKSTDAKNRTDHTGREFPTVNAMLEFYHLSGQQFYYRRNHGWTLEESLTGRRKKSDKEITPTVYQTEDGRVFDHTGQVFKNTAQMLKKYDITSSLFHYRIQHGWPLEEALTGKKRKPEIEIPDGTKVTDHLGQTFDSVKAMLKFYNVDSAVYYSRIRAGWTLEEALTGGRISATDHTGRKFHTRGEMLKYYGISHDVFKNRKRAGWDLEKILTTPTGKPDKPSVDHEGREFPTVRAMLKYHNVQTNAYYTRLRNGWTLEEALTGHCKPHPEKYKYQDQNGVRYRTRKELLEAHGVTSDAYYSRIRDGWSKERAMNEPVKSRSKPCVDHTGREFSSQTEMIRFYGIEHPEDYYSRRNHGWTLEEALTGVRKKDPKTI